MYVKTLRVKLKCLKHPRYNPEKAGYRAFVSSCHTCASISDIAQKTALLEESLKNCTFAHIAPKK